MKTQELLREKLKTGEYLDFDVEPKIIQTLISNVYLCEDRVYKMYKDDSDFFNKNLYDISSKEERHSFTKKDFQWNSTVTPEVYTELKGVRVNEEGDPEWSSVDDADELIIIMNKIDMSQGLMDRLLEGSITDEDCFKIGYQLGERMSVLGPVENDSRTWDMIMGSLIEDLESWMNSVDQYKELSKKYVSHLSKFHKAHEEEMRLNEDMSECVDLHAENAAYIDGQLLPFDLFPPKPLWRKQHKDIGFYRIASDIYALQGESGFIQLQKGYEEYVERKLDSEYIDFWILYSAVIMAPYMYMLAEHNDAKLVGAERYQKFIEDFYNKIS